MITKLKPSGCGWPGCRNFAPIGAMPRYAHHHVACFGVSNPPHTSMIPHLRPAAATSHCRHVPAGPSPGNRAIPPWHKLLQAPLPHSCCCAPPVPLRCKLPQHMCCTAPTDHAMCGLQPAPSTPTSWQYCQRLLQPQPQPPPPPPPGPAATHLAVCPPRHQLLRPAHQAMNELLRCPTCCSACPLQALLLQGRGCSPRCKGEGSTAVCQQHLLPCMLRPYGAPSWLDEHDGLPRLHRGAVLNQDLHHLTRHLRLGDDSSSSSSSSRVSGKGQAECAI
jgi:hypothetical protein